VEILSELELVALGLRFGINKWGLRMSQRELAERLGITPRMLGSLIGTALKKLYTEELISEYTTRNS